VARQWPDATAKRDDQAVAQRNGQAVAQLDGHSTARRGGPTVARHGGQARWSNGGSVPRPRGDGWRIAASFGSGDRIHRHAPSVRFPSNDGLLRLDVDDSKVQGLDLGSMGLDQGSIFFIFKN
jgi:hypothetical protein